MSYFNAENPIAIIEEEARTIARYFGIAASDDVAAALVDRIVARLGGQNVYFPQQATIKLRAERQLVRSAIRQRFDGTNINDLAQEFSLSPRHVRRLLVRDI